MNPIDGLVVIIGKCMMGTGGHAPCSCQKGRVNTVLDDDEIFVDETDCAVCSHDIGHHEQINCTRDSQTGKLTLLKDSNVHGLAPPPPLQDSHRRHSSSSSRKTERSRNFAPYPEPKYMKFDSTSTSGSATRRRKGGNAQNKDVFTRNVMILLADYKGGVPKQSDIDHMLNQGRMICDVDFSKSSNVKENFESISLLLKEHDYRFLNVNSKLLVDTIYKKVNFPSISTMQLMYKSNAKKANPVLIQSEAFYCINCDAVTSVELRGCIEDQVNASVYVV
jgi:hypothetical protein